MNDFKLYDDEWEFLPEISREWMLQIAREAYPDFVVDLTRVYVVRYQPSMVAWKVAWFDEEDAWIRNNPIGYHHEEVVVLAKWADAINKEINYIGIGPQSHALVVAQK